MTEEFLESFLEKEIGPIEHIKMLPGPVALVTFTQKEGEYRCHQGNRVFAMHSRFD